MKKQEIVFVGQATEAQIAEWKKTYLLGIYGVKVGGHIIYFQNPNFDHLNYMYSLEDNSHLLEMWKGLAEVTKIGGSDVPLNDPRLFTSVMSRLRIAAAGERAELVNL